MSKVIKKQQSTLICGAEVLCVNADNRQGYFDILIEGDTIARVSKKISRRGVDTVINAKGKVVLPGFVQTHVHLCQTLMRGLADDLVLLDWLRGKIWPYEGALNANEVSASAKLSIAELLLGGTTTILDMGTVKHTDALFIAAQKMGIRYCGGKTIMDLGSDFPASLKESPDDAMAESIRLAKRWQGKNNDRLRYAFSPRFILCCSDELIKRCVTEARKMGCMLHTHASENRDEVAIIKARAGMGNVEHLHSLGFSGPDVMLAHSVWTSAKERKILAQTGTHIAHCPSANLKLASGIAPVVQLLESGIDVSLGADGAPCNNRLDAFTEMRSAALLHKVRDGAEALPAKLALQLATRRGALALGWKQCGSIAEGFKADIQLLDLNKPHLAPATGDLTSRVVYAAQSSDVDSVWVDGKLLVSKGALTGSSLKNIIAGANRSARQVTDKMKLL